MSWDAERRACKAIPHTRVRQALTRCGDGQLLVTALIPNGLGGTHSTYHRLQRLPGRRPIAKSARDSVQMQDNLPADDSTRPLQPTKPHAALFTT